MARSNDGAPGVDGVTFEAIEESGAESFLRQIQEELVTNTYRPMRARKKEIPKDGGQKVRILSIPSIRDRVVQGALKLILEYLNEVDRMLEKAVDITRRGKSTNVQYARFADDMVVLIDAERRNDWLVKAIDRRLREELAKLRVAINEDKSRMVDLKTGESFTFLGFEYRRVLSLQRKWRPHYAPKLKKRTALFEKLREIFRQNVSWPVEKVIAKINPILRGWVNYFRVGHSSLCFGVVKRWVEKKVRQHLMRARGRKGFGWTRWSSDWFYERLGLFNDYRLRRWSVAKAAPGR
jgi:RNA-directed DNA polymerase